MKHYIVQITFEMDICATDPEQAELRAMAAVSKYELDCDGIESKVIDEWEKEAPTIEAEPVRHGRWDDSNDGITPYCTVCGRTHSCFNRTPDFCPNCGARMNLEVNNE